MSSEVIETFVLILLSPSCICLRVFVQGSVGTGVQVLSVSHSGIKLLKTVKSSAAAPDYFRVLRPYTYVRFLQSLSKKFLFSWIQTVVASFYCSLFFSFVAVVNIYSC